jgi:hypothetical protein
MASSVKPVAVTDAPALSSYVKNGYEVINRELRLKNARGPTMAKVAAIDEELLALPRAAVIETYRYAGFLTDYKDVSLRQLDRFCDPAYLSTSKDIGCFERWGAKKGKIYITVRLLAHNTAARDLATVSGAKEKEAEVLFPRETPFSITLFSNSMWKSGIFITLQELAQTK